MTPLVFTRLLRASSALTPVMLAALAFTPAALANPTGGTVKAGQAEITTPDPSTLLINQSTNRAVIDWKKFDIDAGETTRFKQPSSQSWTLNRVVGSQDPSRILGTLQANGNVVIVNPDGIYFGPGSRIDVNRLIATTSGISNDNFMSGNMIFDQPGNLSASIVNEGAITINDYGLAALVAPAVRNSGVINARLGQINLASGNIFTIDPYGDGLVKLSINDEIKNDIYDVATGKKITDLVKNDGTLMANGGVVALTATTARKIVNSVVNNTGVIEANTVGRRGGKIILGARTSSSKRRGAPRQVVRVSGRLQATAYPVPTRVTVPTPAPTGRGKIEITGETIVATNAVIDASGIYGGGTILIGGDYMGGNGDPDTISGYDIPLENYIVPTASVVTLDEDVVIKADGVDNADGGKVIVWSDEANVTAAKITARGGEDSGDGGFIETSGKFLSALVAADASAPHGTAGTWLLDPIDAHIKNAPDANFAITVETIFPGITGNSARPTASPSVIRTSNIEGAINTGTNVRVITRGSVGGEPGDIYLEDDVTKSAGGDVFVSIDSANNVYFSPNVDLVSTSGKVTLHVYATDGKIIGNNVGRIDTNGGQFLLTARDGIDFHSTRDMPDFFTIDVNPLGPSPLAQVIYDITFDDDTIKFSHDNTTAKVQTDDVKLIDATATGQLRVILNGLNGSLENNSIRVQNNRTWSVDIDANRAIGAANGHDLDGTPEITSDGAVLLPFRNTEVAGIIPVVEVDATNANNCYGLTCIATGPSGQARIDAYVNPPNNSVFNPPRRFGPVRQLVAESTPLVLANALRHILGIRVGMSSMEMAIATVNHLRGVNNNPLIRKTTVRAFGIPLMPYGNYGGPGWTGGIKQSYPADIVRKLKKLRPPENILDKAFYAHDLAYAEARGMSNSGNKLSSVHLKYGADLTLLKRMRMILEDGSLKQSDRDYIIVASALFVGQTKLYQANIGLQEAKLLAEEVKLTMNKVAETISATANNVNPTTQTTGPVAAWANLWR